MLSLPHRCEAIARGLGFKTYAALLAEVKEAKFRTTLVRGNLFVSYLADHGFDVSAKPFYHATAKVALRDVWERTPKLTAWGIGAGGPQLKDNGRWENVREMNARFLEERSDLMDDGKVDLSLHRSPS